MLQENKNQELKKSVYPPDWVDAQMRLRKPAIDLLSNIELMAIDIHFERADCELIIFYVLDGPKDIEVRKLKVWEDQENNFVREVVVSETFQESPDALALFDLLRKRPANPLD